MKYIIKENISKRVGEIEYTYRESTIEEITNLINYHNKCNFSCDWYQVTIIKIENDTITCLVEHKYYYYY